MDFGTLGPRAPGPLAADDETGGELHVRPDRIAAAIDDCLEAAGTLLTVSAVLARSRSVALPPLLDAWAAYAA